MPSFRATVRWSFPVGSGGGTNTWHIRANGGLTGTPGDEPDVIMGWIRDFYETLDPLFPTATTISWDGQLQEVLTEAPAFQGLRTPWSVTGGQSTVYAAAANMACVTWRTEAATRSGRGRTFLGPLRAGAVASDGTLTGTDLGIVREAASTLVSQSNTNDGIGAVGVFSAAQNTLRDIVAGTVTDQVAILRSRRD